MDGGASSYLSLKSNKKLHIWRIMHPKKETHIQIIGRLDTFLISDGLTQ